MCEKRLAEKFVHKALLVFEIYSLKFSVDQIACYGNGDRNVTKAQTFRYRSLLSEQNQNDLIWSAY
jgi:hypothetical protein